MKNQSVTCATGLDRLLGSLCKVRGNGPNRWLACCPSHDDRSPSLSIKLAEDGRVLVHCFAGCPAQEIVHSVGMRMRDLFPDNNFDHHAFARRQEAGVRAERALLDVLIVQMAQGNVRAKKELTELEELEVREAMHRLKRNSYD